MRRGSLTLESGDFRWATTLHEVRDFPAQNRALSESNPLLPFEVRREPCRKALVAVDPSGQDMGVDEDHRDASQSPATPSKGSRYSTGKPASGYRLADGVPGTVSSGRGVMPIACSAWKGVRSTRTEPSAVTTTVTWTSLLWQPKHWTLRSPLLGGNHRHPICQPAGQAPKAPLTGQGSVSFSAISSHFETRQPRLVADLSGEWSRIGSSCLDLTRFRSLGHGLGGPSRTA